MNKEKSDKDILLVKDILKDYPALSHRDVYEILGRRGCPIMRGGGQGSKYKIARGKFEEFAKIR